MHSYVPWQTVSLYPTFSFSELFTMSTAPLLNSVNRKKMAELWALCCHYQRPSPSLYIRGQMWTRDSGEFVMSKCNIRQQAQLTEPQGTQSQLLNRAEHCWTGLSAVVQCHTLNCVWVCDCVWYAMYGFWVRAFQRADECLKMNCAGCTSPYCLRVLQCVKSI